MAKVSEACLGQSAASTASEIVVLLLVRICIKSVLNLCLTLKKEISGAIVRKSVRKNVLGTGSCIMVNWMPFIYARFFGLLGLFRVILARTISLFRPMMLEVSECDMRVTVNKSCALAAQTFMIAMANEGYDTCPLEGFDSRRMKKLLKLPHGAGINMVIPCGIRDGNKGIWGERGRVPFDEIYHRI